VTSLTRRIVLRFGLAVPAFALIFFVPAGSLRFSKAWVYMGLLFLPMFFNVLYFMKRDPALLERRLRTREREREQQVLVRLFGLFMLAGLLIPGFDFRWEWSRIPGYLVLIADAVVLSGYGLFFLVMKENTYLSRTVDIDAGQRVITTGPYAVVRHPMYAGVLLILLFTPIALGSWWALIPMIPLPAILVWRIRSEERILTRDLAGYDAYRRTVPNRLIPFVW